MKKPWAALASIVLILMSAELHAAGGSNAPAEGVNYITISPPLVVNYGGPGKARFIKAELSLRAENAADATKVTHHLPLIRDRLVSILSAQTEEVISTAEGKEYLRVYALSEINKALLAVEGEALEAPGDEKSVEKPVEKPGENPSAQALENSAPPLPTAADVQPVKGPASDLFFNNFVVQK